MIRKLLKIFSGGQTAAAPRGESSGEGILSDLENFVHYTVKALVNHPDEIEITVDKENDQDVIKINCRKEDIGKIVGKRGKTIMAIRSLVGGAANRLNRRVAVEVMD